MKPKELLQLLQAHCIVEPAHKEFVFLPLRGGHPKDGFHKYGQSVTNQDILDLCDKFEQLEDDLRATQSELEDEWQKNKELKENL